MSASGYIKEVFNDTHALMNVTKHHCAWTTIRNKKREERNGY
jgi:hypothetical protein